MSGSYLTSVPTGTVSGSQQIDDLGFLKVDGDDVVSGSVLRTLDSTNVISGSEQITDFGFISESFSTDGTGILSGSSQVGALGFIS